jgi:hypothetical protein
MRLLPLLTMILLAWGTALADSTPAAEPTPPGRPRLTTEQRFERANVTADGKLTLAQAQQRYKTIARNFSVIDRTGKGFVTIEDVRAWQESTRNARQAARMAADDPLRPRHAVQRRTADPTADAEQRTWRAPGEDAPPPRELLPTGPAEATR